MPGVIRIRSKSNPKRICGKIITGKWQSVDLDAYLAYKKTRMGKIVVKEHIEELKGNKNAKALNSAEVEELKVVRATDKKRIKNLEEENAGLKAKIVELEEKLEGYTPAKDASEDVEEADTEQEPQPKEEFSFDPEVHTIDHRGGGSYFVMDLNEEKVYGPLTDEERATFNAMIED